jgi:RimJ/RimL family protein N-acetyltransferase
MSEYKALKKQNFLSHIYSLVPIRYEDRYLIMQWRNDQMYHLRQNEPLTKEQQDLYFNTVVAELFEQERPGQVLFSYLENDNCIGYGGLVHIDWANQHAEISFIMDTRLETKTFEWHWKNYLPLIEELAFSELNLHKLFTYAFNLRPLLYTALEGSGYVKEAVLKEHCKFDGRFEDVVIHSKIRLS